MTLRGIIIGIAVCLPAMVFALTPEDWQKLKADNPIDFYTQEIMKSLERLKSETERLAITQIIAELDKKSYRDILGLKLAPDVCQEIACRDVSPDTVRRYVVAYADMRIADDAHQTALRNAAAAERSALIAVAAASVSLLSLLISVLSYRRTSRSTKSAIPA
jgi:hypothetical protein